MPETPVSNALSAPVPDQAGAKLAPESTPTVLATPNDSNAGKKISKLTLSDSTLDPAPTLAPDAGLRPEILPASNGMGTILLISGLGAIAAIFIIATILLWSQTADLKTTLAEKQNRTDQAEAAVVQMQTRLAGNKTATARLQKQLDESKANSEQIKSVYQKE